MPAPQERIDEVMDWFDFNKVSRVMEFLDWQWVYPTDGVPTEADLRQKARELLHMAWDYSERSNEESFAGTGGFTAEADAARNWIRLTFRLADWESIG